MKQVEIIKSENDQLEYDSYILDNKLELILVEDNQNEMCGASVIVKVGSAFDTLPGIAHFLEHMLFMGSDKYPKESHFMEDVSKHGGTTNAMTMEHATIYYFMSNDKNYLKILDMFSNFFISPLLREDCINREKEAVNSESEKNLNNNNWITLDMMKKMFHPNHPANHYTCGNNDTLKGSDLYLKVKHFYENFYSSQEIAVILYYNKHITKNEILDIGINTFGKIKNRNLNLNKSLGPILKNNHAVTFYPKENINSITVLIEFDIKDFNYNNSPVNFLSHLLNSQTKGSLYDTFFKQQYLISLSGGSSIELYDRIIYTIHIELTNEGYLNKKYIIKTVFEYFEYLIKCVRESYELFKNNYEDLIKISKRIYHTGIKIDISEFITKNSIEISAGKKPEDLVSAILKSPTFEEFKPHFENLIFQLENTPICIILASQTENIDKLNLVDKIYNVKYHINNFDRKLMINNSSKSKFKIFQMNPYISSEINVKRKSEELKTKILKYQDKYTLYYGFNSSYKMPMANIFLVIRLKDLLSNITDYVGFLIYIDTIYSTINEQINILENADYNFSISLKQNFNLVKLKGYVNKLEDASLIIDNIFKTPINENSFDTCKERLKKTFLNFKTDNPYTKVSTLIKKKLLHTYYTPYEGLEVIDTIYFNDAIKSFFKQFKKAETIFYISGNIEKVLAEKIADRIYTNIPIKHEILMKESDLRKDIKTPYKKIYKNNNINENNSVFTLSFDLFEYKIGITPLWEKYIIFEYLLSSIISMKYFDALRTKDQLGYIVKAIKFNLDLTFYKSAVYTFLVQSPKADTKFIYKRTKKFLFTEMNEFINNLDDKKFKSYLLGIESLLKVPFNNLFEESEFYLQLVMNNFPVYNIKLDLLQYLDNFTVNDFKNMFNELIINNKNYYVFGIDK